MALERKMFRGMFAPGEIVELKQICFTSGRVFTPGKYIVGELPDTAFDMGLVEQLPPVKGKNAEVKNIDEVNAAPGGSLQENVDPVSES